MFLALLLSLFFLLLPTGVQAQSDQSLDLTQLPVKLMLGDDPAYAVPDFADDDWQQHDVFAIGDAVARDGGLDARIFWQRIHFDGTALPDLAKPALHIGVLVWGNILYLNGVEFARVAMLEEPFGGIDAGNDKGMPRVFAIPPDLLKRDGMNVLAIRSVRGGLDASILAGPVEITEESTALSQSRGKTLGFVLYNSMAIFIFILAFLVTLIVWLVSRETNGLGWLVLTFLCLLPLYIFNSSLALFLDLSISPVLFPFLTANLSALCLVPMLEFSARHLKIRIRLPVRLLQLMILLLPIIPEVGSDFLFPIRRIDTLIWMFFLLLTFMLITWWAVRRALQWDRRAYPIVIGATAIWIGAGLVLGGGERWFFAHTGTGSGDITIPVFLISLAWAGMQPLFEARARLAKAQSEVIEVQEYERRRIAYDIHDGVGQWLSTIKLNLQMLQGQHRDGPVAQGMADVVGHVDAAISDTRRIAHDLSPAMIEKQGLIAAMQSHADVIRSRAGINVRIEIEDEQESGFDATSEGHLYRIYQEALQNAIKHGRATDIRVSFSRNGNQFRFTIKDNGTGFDTNAPSKGLGLASMHRRAELLGATLDVKSVAGKGAVVVVER
jgi:signal transduction histidine kinase